MTNPPDAAPQGEAESLYGSIAREARYGHYVRIPERICRCLDYFKVAASRRAVRERLHAYYLFIGVVDDQLDSGRVEAGADILERLGDGRPDFGEGARLSHALLVTEVLKRHIGEDVRPSFSSKLGELYGAVVGERAAGTLRDYVEQRRAVGRLTAELSYLLIRPLLARECEELRRFLQEVGEVGCLVDSTIDLRSDGRLGLLGFRPTWRAHFRLAARTLGEGLRVSLKHPRLSGLFIEGLCDDLFDRLRARPPRAEAESDRADAAGGGYACERAA